MTATFFLSGEDAMIVGVNIAGSGDPHMTIQFGEVTVYPAGFGEHNARAAEMLASELFRAAAQIREAMARRAANPSSAEPEPEPDPSPAPDLDGVRF